MKASRFYSIILTAGICATTASASAVFTNIPSPLPTAFASSFGFSSEAVTQFGGILQPDLTNGTFLTSATVVLQNYATQAAYSTFGNATGYVVPLTLTLYNVNSDGSVGSSFATSSVSPTINWATNANCISPQTTCDVQAVQFGFGSQALPSQFIWGLSYPTAYSTGGTDQGPENSLNLAMTFDSTVTGGPTPGFIAATVGTDLAYSCAGGPPSADPSTDYCETVYFADLSDAYQQFQDFTPGQGTGVIEFDASQTQTPEPATFGLIGLGLVGLALAGRRNKRA